MRRASCSTIEGLNKRGSASYSFTPMGTLTATRDWWMNSPAWKAKPRLSTAKLSNFRCPAGRCQCMPPKKFLLPCEATHVAVSKGVRLADGGDFLVRLPHRQSFRPDASYYAGPKAGMKFMQGAPVFAVEVRSENDYGPAAEREMAAKRADYFAAGYAGCLGRGPALRRCGACASERRRRTSRRRSTVAARTPRLSRPCRAGRCSWTIFSICRARRK